MLVVLPAREVFTASNGLDRTAIVTARRLDSYRSGAQYAAGRAERVSQVSESLEQGGLRRSAQSEFWPNIAAKGQRMGVDSKTGALSAYLASDEGMRSYFESGIRSEDRSQRLMLTGALEIARDLARAPVLIVPRVYGGSRADNLLAGLSIYPAVQNLLLAARGLGLGTVLTTFQARIEPTVRELLRLPDDARPIALIPLGFPDAKFGPTRRKPVEEVVYWDSWGNSRSR